MKENIVDGPTIDNKIVRDVKSLSKLRVNKIPLKKILNDDADGTRQSIIFDAVNRTHQIVIHVYQFIRLYILKKYHKNQEIPVITLDFIVMVFKTLVKECGRGNTPKGSNLSLYNELLLIPKKIKSSFTEIFLR